MVVVWLLMLAAGAWPIADPCGYSIHPPVRLPTLQSTVDTGYVRCQVGRYARRISEVGGNRSLACWSGYCCCVARVVVVMVVVMLGWR